jgi:hypothetical protein
MRDPLFQITTFNKPTATRVEKAETAIAIRRGVPHSYVDLPPLVSVEATGVTIPIGNSEILLASVYKSPGRACSDPDITELFEL